MKNLFEHISRSTIDRYSKRYSELGIDVKSLGWGSTEQQIYRFQQVQRIVDCTGRSILDIGCGFGDLKNFFFRANIEISSYLGWDINPDLIKAAKKIHKDSNKDFLVKNLLEESLETPLANIGIMLGLLNFNYNNRDNNMDFTKEMLSHAFSSIDQCLVVDFLSSNLNPSYPREDCIFYHDPTEILDYAFSLTSNVRLYHDYAPIPQKEFAIVLTK